MNQHQLLELPSFFSQIAIALDNWNESRASNVAAARCTLSEMLSNANWERPMIENLHMTLVCVAADVLENVACASRLKLILGQEFYDTDASDIVELAHKRYNKLAHLTAANILPSLRILIGNLLDDSIVRNPENRELVLTFCLALSRRFLYQLRSEDHMRRLDAWTTHQQSRGYKDPFYRYSNTDRC